MSITIDNGVELPRRRGGNSNGTVYPFDEMKPGDSFFVPGMLGGKGFKAAEEHARRHRHKHLEFTSRATECDDIYKTHGVRVWRIR